MIVERLDPFDTTDEGNRRLHLERYAWAAERVHGREVLDIACGLGYGSAMLADGGSDRSVLGVDRSAEAVIRATERHGSERVRFETAADAETFDTERRFDTIVSLETMEHLPRPVAFLRRMHALLRPGGRLIVSAPVREQPGDNPFHEHCFRPETLRALVSEGFEVELALDQQGAYLTLAARRRDVPALVLHEAPAGEAPRATIVLVTWNSMANVVDLVSAIRALTRPPYELLVVDNASTDGTRSFLKLFAGAPGVRVIENAGNRRCAAATNQAIELARTEFLIYLCASHALVTEPGWDEELVGFLRERPEVGIAGDVWNPGFPVASHRYAPGWTPEGHGRDHLRHVQGGAWVARRALFAEVGPFEAEAFPHGGMDVELSYRLLSLGKPLGHCPAISCPPSPEVPERRPGVAVYHPASERIRAEVRERLGLASNRLHVWVSGRPPAPASIGPFPRSASGNDDSRPAALVFCERVDNESFCASTIRELSAFYDVRPFGPGWPAERLADVDPRGARFYLELDSASGRFCRPEGLESLKIPKFAWLVDTHKKPMFHQAASREMDLTFFAMKTWGQVLEGRTAWLPLHFDQEIFKPADCARDIDIAFVGSHAWRAEPIVRIGEKHGLRVHVSCTTGAREKSETAAIYARSKLVFNRHVTNDLNFRVFEAMACGRVVLTDAQWNGQYELFEDGRHFVLYKDERDLETQILRYLGDDAARARIESDAAENAHARHSTRARARQLREAIEAELRHERKAASPPAAAIEPSSRRRWLVLAGPEPATVEMLTYAERLARGLAGRGHDVVVARERRRALPGRGPRAGEPRVMEIDPGPIPTAPTPTNDSLAASAALHMRFDAIAREHGPFDVILGEGAFGALVAQPVAERLGAPFLLALESCEVAKRSNRLTREQLYLSELEHWGADRARAVIVPCEEVGTAVRSHYRSERVHHIPPPPPRVRVPAEGGRLIAALGLARAGFELILAPVDEPSDAFALLAARHGTGVLAGSEVWLRVADAAPVRIADRPLAGPALAAVMVAARSVAAVSRADPRVAEDEVLRGDGSDASSHAGSLSALEALVKTEIAVEEAAHVLQ